MEEILMFVAREDYAIVMRSFWPISPVVGEGMMRVAEGLAQTSRCRVVTQSRQDLRSLACSHHRGKGVRFSSAHSLSNSSSNILVRVSDLIWFAVYVFFILAIRRPRVVYVATDPPLLVPFVVAICSKLFQLKYIYHVQDIHPEASAIVYPILKKLPLNLFYNVLKTLDIWVVKNSEKTITLTSQMSNSLRGRGELPNGEIKLVDNPAADHSHVKSNIEFDFCFVGNAGRLQRMPLLVASVRAHLKAGHKTKFAFAGAGVMAVELELLSKEFPENCIYLGKVPVENATRLIVASKWALLPIDDAVCDYAFPSKASTYAISGRPIAAICGHGTSVQCWMDENNLGEVIEPDLIALTSFFEQVTSGNKLDLLREEHFFPKNKDALFHRYSTERFVSQILQVFRM